MKNDFTIIKELIEIVKDKVDKMEMFLHTTMQSVRTIKEQQSVMNKKLDGIQETVDSHTGALITIEKELKGYKDAYQENNSNMKKLEKRVELLEEDTGIEAPPELQLTEVH